jgi:hypothetical protein
MLHAATTPAGRQIHAAEYKADTTLCGQRVVSVDGSFIAVAATRRCPWCHLALWELAAPTTSPASARTAHRSG